MINFDYNQIKFIGQSYDDVFSQLCNKIAEVYEKFGEEKTEETCKKLVDFLNSEENGKSIVEENAQTISDLERLIMIQLLDAEVKRLKSEVHDKNALKYKL